jgi:type I restriction enzyme S subunit
VTRELVRDLVARRVLLVEDGNHGEYRPRPDEFVSEGTPFIRAADMSSGVIDFTMAGKINSVARARIRKGIGAPGDVIISHKGTVGRVAVAPIDSPDFVCSPQTTFWRSLDPAVIDQGYLRYVMQAEDFVHQLDMLKGQTDMAPYVSLTDQRSIKINVPAIKEQKAIAAVLGALDDKVAANDRSLFLLDEWIRTAFKGIIGEPRSLGSLASIIRDQKNPSVLATDTVYLGLEHLPRRRMWAVEVGTSSEVTSAKSGFRGGDVLFGKLRPYFHKVVSASDHGICSTDIMVVRAMNPEFRGFVLAACASDEAVRSCSAMSEGTRMPRTSWKDLSSVLVPWPGDGSARWFSSQVSKKSDLAHSLIAESRLLGRTRNEILPLLMSGEMHVADVGNIADGSI